MDFVWNSASAEEVRSASERAMRRQAENMRRTVSNYDSVASSLEAQVASQEHIAATAMTMKLITDSNGIPRLESVEDRAARNTASLRAADMRNQASDLRTAKRNLELAIENLEDAIVQTNYQFAQMQNEAQVHDHSAHTVLQDSVYDMNAYIHKMEMVRDSFDSRFPLITMIESVVSLDGMPRDLLLDAILAAALAGCPIFTAIAGDPVNMSTGNFIYTNKDMSVPGRYPLSFKRFYNAIGVSEDGVMGLGWTHIYNIHLRTEGNAAYISFGDGHVEPYTELSDGKYISSVAGGSALLKAADGWKLRSPAMQTHHFDKSGLLQSITDILGTGIEFAYNADGLLTQVSTQSGHLDFSYTKNHLLSTVSDKSGRKTELKYSGGKLSGVVYPTGATSSYTYDAKGRLSELTDAAGIAETKTEFDNEGRAVKQLMADGGIIGYKYDDYSKASTLVEQNGSEIIYRRDDKNRTTSVKYLDGEKKFRYDSNNRRTQDVDKLGNKTEYAYNIAGNISSVVDACGVKTEFSYTSGNQLSKVSINGKDVSKNTYDDSGNLIALEDALENKTELSYIENGIPETMIPADGSRISLAYDERRNVTQIADGAGVVTRYAYDEINRVVATTDGNGNETKFKYDANGNITEVRNALGDVRSYEYNEGNKVVRTFIRTSSQNPIKSMFYGANIRLQLKDSELKRCF